MILKLMVLLSIVLQWSNAGRHLRQIHGPFEMSENKISMIYDRTPCLELQCPEYIDPQCLSIENLKTRKITEITVLNKCEQRFVDCHPDYISRQIPMKYCNHPYTYKKNGSSKYYDETNRIRINEPESTDTKY